MGVITQTNTVTESVQDSSFVVQSLVINDPDAVEYLRSLDESNRANAVSVAVRFGLLALRDFQSISKMDWIDKRFQIFETEIQDRLDAAGQKLEDYLGENGELERAFSDAEGPIRALLDPAKEGSPIAELSQSIRSDIQTLRDELVGERARAEEAEKGTQKGFKFEDDVCEFLQPICAKMGDNIQMVGKKKVAGRMVGDIIIQVQEKYMDTPLLMIIEAKAGSISAFGENGLLEQMDGAMELRGAHFAIGVVRYQCGLKGVDGSFAYIQPNKVLCSFDDDGRALELAYRLARTEMLMTARDELQLDTHTRADLSEKITEVKKGLKTLSTVKVHATHISNSAEEIRVLVDNIQEDVSRILGDVESILRSAVVDN